MPKNPAWRYYERDPILRELIRDRVPITVENYIRAAWRSELPETLTSDTTNFLAELSDYERIIEERQGRQSASREGEY